MSDLSWRPSKEPTPFEPRPMAIVDVSCKRCRYTYRYPLTRVQSREAQYWQERCERLMGSLNSAVERCRTAHGDDPMRQDFAAMLLRIREHFGIREEGEEWKG